MRLLSILDYELTKWPRSIDYITKVIFEYSGALRVKTEEINMKVPPSSYSSHFLGLSSPDCILLQMMSIIDGIKRFISVVVYTPRTS